MTDQVIEQTSEVVDETAEQRMMDEVLAQPVQEGGGAGAAVATAVKETPPAEETPAPFVGNYSAERVAELLGKLEALSSFDPTALETKLVRSLGGHLGPIANRLIAIESMRDVEIDPAFFAKVKELDAGLGELFEANLPGALKGKRHDPEEFLKPLLEERLGAFGSSISADLHDYKQEILVDALVPDWKELADNPAAEAFVGKLPDDEIVALDNWFNGKTPGQKNGKMVAGIFAKLQGELAAAAEAMAAKEKALKAVARPTPRGSAIPTRSSSLDEEQRAMDEVLNQRP